MDIARIYCSWTVSVLLFCIEEISTVFLALKLLTLAHAVRVVTTFRHGVVSTTLTAAHARGLSRGL